MEQSQHVPTRGRMGEFTLLSQNKRLESRTMAGDQRPEASICHYKLHGTRQRPLRFHGIPEEVAKPFTRLFFSRMRCAVSDVHSPLRAQQITRLAQQETVRKYPKDGIFSPSPTA